MIRYAQFDTSGRILGILTSDFNFAESQGIPFVEVGGGVDDSTHYVCLDKDPPLLMKKRGLGVTQETIGLEVKLHNVPVGTRVEVQGFEFAADDATTVIEFEAPGTYEIQFYPPPQYLDEVLEVTVG